MLAKVVRLIPDRIKKIIVAVGLAKIASFLLGKHSAELVFQSQWANEFKNNKDKVKKYWIKFRFLDEIIKTCDINSSKKILDVGCGISTVLHFINGIKIGIDPLAQKYKDLYNYPDDIEIIKASGESIPFLDGSFDVIFSTNVLDHVSDAKKTVTEICRVLKSEGFFILTVEIFSGIESRDPAHPYSFTKKDVYNLIKNNFDVVWEKESPWIGLKAYVNNSAEIRNTELILVLRKNRD